MTVIGHVQGMAYTLYKKEYLASLKSTTYVSSIKTLKVHTNYTQLNRQQQR